MKKTKAVVSWAPPQSEINDIRDKCGFIAATVTRLLPTAIYVGEWFNKQKDKCMHGEWLPWLQATFPELGQSTVLMYMQIANYRTELEAHFKVTLTLPAPPKTSRKNSNKTSNVRNLPRVEVEKVPTISEARAWITQRNKQNKEQPDKPKGKKPPKQKRRGPQNTLDDTGVTKVQEFFQATIAPFVATFQPNEHKAVWDWLAGLCHQDQNENLNGAEPE